MNKEELYDEKIFPLMTQIIAICQKNGIAMIASYHIPNADDDELLCTTHLTDGDNTPHPRFMEAARIIRQHSTVAPMMITTEHSDGSKTLTAVF